MVIADNSPSQNILPDNAVIYRDDICTLEISAGQPYFIRGSQRYQLSSHGYEPCTYLIDDDGHCTTIHNAFEISDCLQAFVSGRTLEAITGTMYDAAAFCRLLNQAAEFASGSSLDIDYLESLQVVAQVRAHGAISKETARTPAELGIKGTKYLNQLLHAKKLGKTPDGRYYAR